MSALAPFMTTELPSSRRRASTLLGQFDDLLQDFISKGGPLPQEYGVMNLAVRHLGDAVRAGAIDRGELLLYVQDTTQRYLSGTMQAEAFERKFGYSGDFQIIDHIYSRHVCDDPHLRLWDLYFHSQAAPVAVRNRKAYFQQLMQRHVERRSASGSLEVLNVASGPGRDMREFFLEQPEADVVVDCVEMDQRAIAHASRLCLPWLDRVTFHHRNVLRYLPTRGYDLVWSAGLFDYLTDKLFVYLLQALLKVTKRGGELVVGNFSDFNPSRDYMELLGHWQLHHRSLETLKSLAIQAGAEPDQVQVMWEPEGVNYFLHIQR
jgi:extracellular factor (EF) 3-hydroxypalmitic acid methyl ester biosynthesis protein